METLLPFEKVKRKEILKKEISTDKQYGKTPEQRSMQELLESGVFCLNKYEGPSSHQMMDFIKHILKIKKVGHGGTIDPKVTGVLPVALGKATRIMDVLLKGGKEYVCLMHVHKLISASTIEKAMKEFVGKITQIPPVRSAVKREKRTREVYYLEILDIDGQDVLFKIGCQAGTYIRKICDDFGRQLGIGAHMHELVRTKAGPFTEREWYSLHDLQDAYFKFEHKNDDILLKKIIKPVEFATSHLGKVWVLDSTVDALCHGISLSIPGIAKINSEIKREDQIAVLSLKGELIGIGRAKMSSEEILKNEKGITISLEKVFMDPEVYPHYQKAKVL